MKGMHEIGEGMGEYSEVKRGLKQGWAVPSWLFNVFCVRIVRIVNEKVKGME